MLLSTRLVAAVLAALPLAAAYPPELARSTREFCQSEPSPALLALHEKIVTGDQPTLDKIAQGEEIIADALAKGDAGLHGRTTGMTVTKRETGELITLDAWFHVVYNSNSTAGGYIPPAKLQEQLQVLNKAYDPSNLGFRLVGSTYTENAAWANDPDGNETPMKTALHRGDSRTLNLYFVPGLGNGGVCVFPNMNAYGNEALALDGCMVGTFSLPGNKGPFNMGLTAVHEVGHWFGLLHTFQGGCDAVRGDFIADTPAERTANVAVCPAGRDTCPELPGLDPIENYMDYSNDACYNTFTPGQTSRMRSLLALVRLGPLS
ncbi:metalloprotease 1 [Cordyceps militaris CM01]|uniref:Metalloprotease 1 n=2 Tax=Cordyceps militaris TaxID=73501 RepID=G3JBL9_CORMM|nr:metalloprotease 1 [Cordyceps militaris CM01]ATY61221.1 metalloprotease 1 [Cordyceps militaris]EGX95324.1 metalloprotease 1 [Cordyceps militaris CM01]